MTMLDTLYVSTQQVMFEFWGGNLLWHARSIGNKHHVPNTKARFARMKLRSSKTMCAACVQPFTKLLKWLVSCWHIPIPRIDVGANHSLENECGRITWVKALSCYLGPCDSAAYSLQQHHLRHFIVMTLFKATTWYPECQWIACIVYIILGRLM